MEKKPKKKRTNRNNNNGNGGGGKLTPKIIADFYFFASYFP